MCQPADLDIVSSIADGKKKSCAISNTSVDFMCVLNPVSGHQLHPKLMIIIMSHYNIPHIHIHTLGLLLLPPLGLLRLRLLLLLLLLLIDLL